MKKLVLLVLSIVFLASTAKAHSVWINTFESHAHKPGHAMICLGWGHVLPMDDILNSVNGKVAIQKFEMIDPSNGKTDLIKPDFKTAKATSSNHNFDIFPADLGAQKIALKEKTAPGVYQISAVSKPNFYTQYIDKKGRQRLQMKPRDQISDIDKILMSVKYQAFAKSYLTVDKWTQPKALGHGLEIIPKTDLSNLHVGDLVGVEVLFYGKPLNATAKSMEFITAASNGFGQPDGFSLFSYIIEGKARFRVQSSGQWMITTNHKDDVTEDGPLKDLYGKAGQVYHGASLTFNVK